MHIQIAQTDPPEMAKEAALFQIYSKENIYSKLNIESYINNVNQYAIMDKNTIPIIHVVQR